MRTTMEADLHPVSRNKGRNLFRCEPQVDRRNDERSKRCWRSSKDRRNTVGALSSSLLSRGLSPYGANVVLALKKQQGRSGLI